MSIFPLLRPSVLNARVFLFEPGFVKSNLVNSSLLPKVLAPVFHSYIARQAVVDIY